MTEPHEPDDLAEPGRRLWASVADQYELAEHEAALLLEAARTVDLLAELSATVGVDGPMAHGKLSPAVVEARQQRLVLARLLAALRLPEDEDTGGASGGVVRPQRRGTSRKPYNLGKAS